MATKCVPIAELLNCWTIHISFIQSIGPWVSVNGPCTTPPGTCCWYIYFRVVDYVTSQLKGSCCLWTTEPYYHNTGILSLPLVLVCSPIGYAVCSTVFLLCLRGRKEKVKCKSQSNQCSCGISVLFIMPELAINGWMRWKPLVDRAASGRVCHWSLSLTNTGKTQETEEGWSWKHTLTLLTKVWNSSTVPVLVRDTSLIISIYV